MTYLIDITSFNSLLKQKVAAKLYLIFNLESIAQYGLSLFRQITPLKLEKKHINQEILASL